jgi:hypothetical protein
MGFEIGTFDFFATGMIDDQPGCCGDEIGAGLLDRQLFRECQQTGKSVLCKIRCTVRATEFSAQPAIQPSVMVAVQCMHRIPMRPLPC